MTVDIGRGVVDDSFEKHDSVFEEQIAEGHLALSRIIAIALKHRFGQWRLNRHGTVPRKQRPADRHIGPIAWAKGHGTWDDASPVGGPVRSRPGFTVRRRFPSLSATRLTVAGGLVRERQ